MSKIFLVFPHQLYNQLLDLPAIKDVMIIEDYLFFKQYQFHKQKLIFHRASMKYYADFLTQHKYSVSYLESKNMNKTLDLFEYLPSGTKEIHYFETDDDYLSRDLALGAKLRNLKVVFHQTPGFLIKQEDNQKYFEKSGNFFQTNYYQKNRKDLNLLMKNGKPLHGKWSFDQDNRHKAPKDLKIPELKTLPTNSYVKEATKYISKNFATNYGNVESFNYPTTFEEASLWLDNFLTERLSNYGTYQDAILSNQTFNFHSVISPLINVGLLTPEQVIHKTLAYCSHHDLAFNNIEGFVRQIVGWREYVRGVYHQIGRKERTSNFWNHQRAIPKSFWNGTTGILPIDDSIKKSLQHAYIHHIERLMLIANFMTLCEFHPNQVYRWFMELFIDAYDWVMVPNVYGMGIYADGGMIVTKPYISSSSYIKKMSNYSDAPWCQIWDGLYWRFINKHQAFFNSNPRTRMMTAHLTKMSHQKLAEHLKTANSFLENLD